MNLNEIEIPLHLEERAGLQRAAELCRSGVPVPAGRVHDTADLIVTDATGVRVPHQLATLACWPDRSIKWLLVDALVHLSPHERTHLFVRTRPERLDAASCEPRLRLLQGPQGISVDTGVAQLRLGEGTSGPILTARFGDTEALQGTGIRIRLTDIAQSEYDVHIKRLWVEEQGPLRAAVVAECSLPESNRLPLRFKMRCMFTAGTACIRLELLIRNTRAAVHPGGLWDLGDPGSCFFRDLSLACFPREPVGELSWCTDSAASECELRTQRWSLYQDSSGGEQWQSPNHLDRKRRSTVSFRGYRVSGGPEGALLAQGNRATPVVTVKGKATWLAAAVQGFWENFPKALRWENDTLEVGVFPRESRGGFELQGGEQKRHTVWLEFGTGTCRPRLMQEQKPLEVCIEPAWVEASGAIPWLSARSPEDDPVLAEYLEQIVAGPRSFFARRETIDEYGWRNFGELYADHEAVDHTGPEPFISHYNNQYDFVFGAFLNFLRTGDGRWRRLMQDAARHHIDIDIYHTQADKAAFNGGLFWHTDHHKPAATCTHRTYSRSNSTGRRYGGGPSNEHNYTSGLLHYFYLSGDREAADSVRELADWVIGLDDGARTVFGLIDSGATGGASRTVEASYHRAGRGAGNSINALLDGYAVTRERRYMEKAQEILQRCIHPGDDIATLQLDDPEHRWSYLVFLQILCKFLTQKQELGELDYTFHYARESLLRYAAWMAQNEVPFKDVLHKVELPTETWPAHDIRKCHVLNVAACYAEGAQRRFLRERAAFFYERCLEDLTSFPTAHLTRPLVILSVYGSVQNFFRKQVEPRDLQHTHNHDFGAPQSFIPQRARLKSVVRSRVRMLFRELARALASTLHTLKLRLRGSG